jgi:hypothetical protein
MNRRLWTPSLGSVATLTAAVRRSLIFNGGRPAWFAALLVTLFVSALLVQRINYRATRATSGHEPAGQIAPPSKTLHR